MEFTIYGQVPAQKNNKSIAYNRATHKPFIMSNQNVKNWQTEAAYQLKPLRPLTPISKSCLSITFYVKDKRRRDLDNMLSTVQDALVKAGIIEDDSWQYLTIGSLTAEIDTKNPRAKITLKVL